MLVSFAKQPRWLLLIASTFLLSSLLACQVCQFHQQSFIYGYSLFCSTVLLQILKWALECFQGYFGSWVAILGIASSFVCAMSLANTSVYFIYSFFSTYNNFLKRDQLKSKRISSPPPDIIFTSKPISQKQDTQAQSEATAR